MEHAIVNPLLDSLNCPIQPLQAGFQNLLIDRGGDRLSKLSPVHGHQKTKIEGLTLEELEIGPTQPSQPLVGRDRLARCVGPL